jgi:signal transduction histidine kinase
MSDTESRRTSRIRLFCLALVATNVVALFFVSGWETAPIHALLAVAATLYAIRPPRTVPTRDALGFGAVLTLVTVGNELLEGVEPINDVYESWLVVALLAGLGLLAVRRAQAASTLENLVAERERLLRRQERLMYDLSHELRTPATIARGHLELLRRSGGAESQAAHIALDELARIDRIVERLVLLARAERGSLVERGEIDIVPFLEDVLLRWSETAQRSWRLGAVPSGILRADPEALRIAIDALVENAVKYTETGDTIELHARANGEELVIEVADSGPGVPLDAAESIFERSSGSREGARPGLGIGLAIVDAIAAAHEGSCRLEPSSSGSRFALRLPGFEAAEREAEAPVEAETG